MIGLKRGTVKLVRHNPHWRQSFEREAKKIGKVFGKDALNIQHVGSTAILGINAKPVVDIVVIVSSLRKVRKYLKALQDMGYKLKANDKRKDRLFFTKGPDKKRTHYLHVGETNNSYGSDMIIFRDYLKHNKESAKSYSLLKDRLAKKYPYDRETYTEKKGKFIETILRKAKVSWKVGI